MTDHSASLSPTNVKQFACPAVMIASPASGQGKTTFTAALARLYRNQGLNVKVFKCGPDFLDPMIHEKASGNPVDVVDTWMTTDDYTRFMLAEAAACHDVLIVEAAMGLFDGDSPPAALARQLGLPIWTVINASAMAQSFGALAYGLKHYQLDTPLAGVIAGQVGGDYHVELLRESLPADIPLIGAIPRDSAMVLPERHLGLVQACELATTLDQQLDKAAALLECRGFGALPPEVIFMLSERESVKPLLNGCRIAIARDDAFAFIYAANLRTLKALGAELQIFSPVAGDRLPECDAVWLPGGYPELHMAALTENRALVADLEAHVSAGRPLYAECGGMLYLLESLTDRHGTTGMMAGLLPGSAKLQERLVNLGMEALDLPEGELRGHSFHYSTMTTCMTPWHHTRRQRARYGSDKGEAVYRKGSIQASYHHAYFASAPHAAATLFMGSDLTKSVTYALDKASETV